MLIKALCDYYDTLEKKGTVLPDGFSKVGIKYKIALNPDGSIATIINSQKEIITEDKKGKVKVKYEPQDILFPKRTEKTAICSNIIDHRPAYIFGIIENKGKFIAKDTKAEKSHAAFIQTNLGFIEGMDTPLVTAFRNFLLSWKPEKEIENTLIKELATNFSKSNYAFCLSGYPDRLLQEETCIKEKWLKQYANHMDNSEAIQGPCSITGGYGNIARIHSKIKGVAGGQASGTTLVCYKNPSEESYGKTQSFNSNISETAMERYCEALNYLLASPKNKYYLDGITIIFWATDASDNCDNLLNSILFGSSSIMSAEETEGMILSLIQDAKQGKLIAERLNKDYINPNVDFYMVGIKPNSSRLAIKFIYYKQYGEIIQNIVKHQMDLSIIGNDKPVALWQIRAELVSGKSNKEEVNPGMLGKLLEAIIYNRPYPDSLLAQVVQRVKIDVSKDVNSRRAGIIKACINRHNRIKDKKEELKVALDLDNKDQAYLCGRLFACLEKLQNDASGGNLNRTIKDSYFSAASVNPNVIFPRLVHLSEYHKKKLPSMGQVIHYEKLIGSITDSLVGGFPGIQNLEAQGKFIVGYYQQKQDFYKKKDN